MATSDQRTHLKAIMDMLLGGSHQVPYVQARPMSSFNPLLYEQDAAHLLAQGKPLPGVDCSEIVTLMCRWAGLRDPNGPTYNYNGFGNTQTIYDALPKPKDPVPHPGALVVFGAATGQPLSNQHVAMVYATAATLEETVLFSHGSSAGPITLTLADYQRAVPSQGAGVFLSTSGL